MSNAKHVATLREPADIKAEAIICKLENEPNVYILKTVYYDENGEKEGESPEWQRIGTPTLQMLLENHYHLPSAEIERLLTS